MITAALFFLAFGIPLFLLIQKYPDFIFWFALTIFFDPGGFITGYLGGNIIGRVNHTDLLFIIMLLALFSSKVNRSLPLNNDKHFKKLFYLLLFLQIYYLFIYGYMVPVSYGREDFIFFLLKNRLYFMALPIMFGVYIFSQRSILLFFKILFYFSIIILSLYLFTILTGIELVPVFTLERYYGSGINRISMFSYGFVRWIFYIGIIIYLLKKKINFRLKHEKWIYYCAILMTITVFLTLTRREFIDIVFSSIIIALIISYIFRSSKLKLSFSLTIPVVLTLLLFFIIFPTYFNYATEMVENTVSLVITGQDTGGRTDYRLSGTGDLIYAKQIIGENLFLGTGYIPMQWSDVVFQKEHGDTFAMAMDASAEVPVYGAFFRLGIFGVLLTIPVYLLIIGRIIYLLKYLRFVGIRTLIKGNKNQLIIIILALTLISLLVSKFTFNAYTLFYEFYAPHVLVVTVVIWGMFYSLSKVIVNQNINYKITSVSKI